MRARVVAVFAGVVLTVGVVLALAPAASAAGSGGFLDLPGIGVLERLTDANAPSVADTGGTTSQHIAKTDRVPAADTSKAEKAAVTADDTALIRSLPGGEHLPVLGVDAASSRRGADGMALALALVVMVLFTRFLVRLNTLGAAA